MAVHGGLAQRAAGGHGPGCWSRCGTLISRCDFVHELAGELIVEARRLHASHSAWQYEFRVTHDGQRLAQGRATVPLASAILIGAPACEQRQQRTGHDRSSGSP